LLDPHRFNEKRKDTANFIKIAKNVPKTASFQNNIQPIVFVLFLNSMDLIFKKIKSTHAATVQAVNERQKTIS